MQSKGEMKREYRRTINKLFGVYELDSIIVYII